MTADLRSKPTQVVGANLIVNERAILFVRESKLAALGRWSLPGGRLEAGESLRAGAAREAFEETGLIVDVGSLLGIYHCPQTLEGDSAMTFVFRSTVAGGKLRTSPEHPEAVFFDRHDVEAMLDGNRVRGSHVRLAIAALDLGSELPADVVTHVGPSRPPRAV
ncbi:MAG: NUDIX hydrolase [Actinobacteria bacterium]|nr:NUDIX hydrolase [Actinomycetota bacterium]